MDSRKNRRSPKTAFLSPLIPVILFCPAAFLPLRGGEALLPDAGDRESSPPPSSPAMEELLDTVSVRLNAIQKESPVFFRQLERKMEMEKDRLVKQFLLALSPALAESPEAAAPQKKKQTTPFHLHRLEDRRILYLSIAAFPPEMNAGLKHALRQNLPEKQPLAGIILDLRDAAGDNPLDGWEVFSLLSAAGETKNEIPHTPVPILAITNGNTSGAAEILAKLLEHTRYGLCIGEKTRGEPFPRTAIRSGEQTLRLPLIPEKLKNLTPDALTPAVAAAAAPRMSIGDLQKKQPLTEQSDPALRRARDLLLSLDTLNQKWRK